MRDNIYIEADLNWRYTQDPESRLWVGICEPLQLTVEADTVSRLHESMSEAVDMLLHEMFATGDFDQFLKDHGWRRVGETAPMADREVYFDVPFNTRLVEHHDLEESLA